jgi:hypothetical protein
MSPEWSNYGCTISLTLRCIRGNILMGPKEEEEKEEEEE